MALDACDARVRPLIVGDELVTNDARLQDDDAVEIRPVISGGAA